MTILRQPCVRHSQIITVFHMLPTWCLISVTLLRMLNNGSRLSIGRFRCIGNFSPLFSKYAGRIDSRNRPIKLRLLVPNSTQNLQNSLELSPQSPRLILHTHIQISMSLSHRCTETPTHTRHRLLMLCHQRRFHSELPCTCSTIPPRQLERLQP
jgi:hypothetical protein